MVTALLVLNLFLNTLLLAVIVRRPLQRLFRQRKKTPERSARVFHDPIEGPRVAVQTRPSFGVTAGYYVEKKARQTNNAGPAAHDIILASHFDGRHSDKNIPEDSYIIKDGPRDYLQNPVPGEEFRARYEPLTDVGMIVPTVSPIVEKIRHAKAMRTLVTNFDAVKDPYAVLGCSPTASREDIERAYKYQSRKNLPERHPGDEEVAQRSREIHAAYLQIMESQLKENHAHK